MTFLSRGWALPPRELPKHKVREGTIQCSHMLFLFLPLSLFSNTTWLLRTGLEVVVATCSADRAFNVIRISQKSWTLRLLQLIFVLFLIITVWALYMATKGLVQNTV